MTTLAWVVFPYLCLFSFFIGHVWRYRFDKFGWTSRSSQMYEDKLLSVASPLFHFGILAVFGGHALMMVPESWTNAVGVTNADYHLLAVFAGATAGIATVIGMAILIVRRRFNLSVLKATTPMDYVMYGLLVAIVLLGTWNTLNNGTLGREHDYRLDVAPWFRSLFYAQPKVDLMASSPIAYQVHDLIALALIGIWPYTRLVHVWSVPLAYVARPYVVYRTRDAHRGARAPRRGWNGPGF